MRYLVLALVLLAGCKQPVAPTVSGQPAGNGWEVRYNAALALAQRGSPKFLDPATIDVMIELLDEQQQINNFRLTMKDGRTVGNSSAARMCLLSGLRAISEYRVQIADADLSPLRPAVEKLAASQDPNLAKEARALLDRWPGKK